MLFSDRPTLTPIPHEWHEAIRQWEINLRARGMKESTVETRVKHLRSLALQKVADTPMGVTSKLLVQWAGVKNWSPETRHSYYMSLITFFHYYLPTGVENPTKEICHSISRPSPVPRPAPEEVIHEALAKAHKLRDQRPAVIIRLAAELGLRRSEIACLHMTDLKGHVGNRWLVIHGKGGKQRVLPCPETLAHAIKSVSSDDNGWVFPGKIDGHLSPRWIAKLATRVLAESWTLHTLRHRFATVAYNEGGHDLLTIQQAMGHENIATTQRYTKYQPDALKAIIGVTQIFPDNAAP